MPKHHTTQDNMLTDYTCPICGLVGSPETHRVGGEKTMVSDPRWARPVHVKCVEGLAKWPRRARDPRGRSGTDDINN